MPEELKDLIEKIKREGVQAAEEKAAVIEAEARKGAQSFLDNAKREAQGLISAAKKEAQQIKNSTEMALRQAARDMLINLKGEISRMLDALIARNVNAALKGESLIEIIKTLINAQFKNGKAGIVITFKEEDLKNLEKPLLSALSDEVKKGVLLKSSDEIGGGFLISFDSGKSHFDFTDNALAVYISSSLKPRLSSILGPSTN